MNKMIRTIEIPVNVAIDKNLSLKAKGLYMVIKVVLDTPEVKINKDILRQLSGVGEKAFMNTWNELKETGYLELKRVGSGYEYKLK